MKNPVELQRIFNPSGCLTQKALDDYVAGKTSPEETRQIEHHISGCPFCSDAVEGHMEVGDADSTHQLLEDVKAKLFGERETKVIGLAAATATKKKSSTRALYWGIAATVVVLALSYVAVRFIIPTSNKSEISLVDHSKSEEEKTVAAADSQSASYTKVVEQAQKKMESGKGGPKIPISFAEDREEVFSWNVPGEGAERYYTNKNDGDNELLVDDLTLLPSGSGVNQPIQDNLKEEENSDELSVTMDKEVTATITETTSRDNRRSDVVGGVQKTTRDSKAPSAASGEVQQQVNDGVSLYNAGDYPSANEKFKDALNNDPNQDQALYYSGMSFFNTAEYDKALPLFEKILKHKNSSYFQAAQWQIAQIYVKKGDAKQARKALNEVIDMNGTYRDDAEKQIDQLPQ